MSRWYGEWLRLEPAVAGFDAARLDSAIDNIGRMRGVQSLLIVRRGYLVAEHYWRGGAKDVPHNLKSASKSVISALVGIAVSQGRFRLDQPIVELLPQLAYIKDPAKQRITVRHLLEMTSGLASGSYQAYDTWVTHSDWLRAAMQGPLQSEPGTRYDYNTANTHLLSAILSATAGQSTRAFAQKHLFGPMGVRIHDWPTDPDGINIGGNNLWLMPRDFARFGQLFLDRGHWQSHQLIPESWVATSVTSRGKTSHDTYGGYGYLWWTPFNDGSYAAVGYGGQYILVSPRTDTVIVVTSTLDSKGDHWERQLFEQIANGIVASITAPELPQTAITTAHINLRSAPTLDSTSLAVVPKGQHVHWTRRDGDWLHARIADASGWLHSDYLRVIEPHVEPQVSAARHPSLPVTPAISVPVANPANDTIAVAEHKLEQLRERVATLESTANAPLPLPRYRVTRDVNFRLSPNLVGELIGKVAKGTEFQALERSEAWLMAQIDGKKGWLHADFARVIEKPSYQSQRAGLASEIHALRSDIERLDQPDDGSAAQPRPAELLAAARDQLGELRAELARRESDMEQLRATLAQNAEELRRMRNEHDSERARLTEQALGLTAAADSVKAELAELLLQQSQDHRRLEALSAEKQQLLVDLGERDQQAEELQKTLASERARIETLLTEAEQQRTENDTLAASLKQLAATEQERSTQIAANRRQIADLEKEVRLASTQLQDFERQTNQLGKENLSLQSALSSSAQHVEQLQQKLASISEAAQQQLRDADDARQQLLSELDAANARSVHLQQQLGELIAREQEQQLALSRQQEDNQTLKADLADLQAQAAEIQQLAQSRENAGKQIRQKLAAETQRLADLERSLNDAKQTIVDLAQQRDDAVDRLGTQAQALSALRNDNAAANERIAALESEKDAIAQTLGETREAFEQQRQSLQTGQQRAIAQDTALEKLNATITSLEAAYAAAKSDKADATAKLADAHEQLERLTAQVKQLGETNAANADTITTRDKQLVELLAQLTAEQRNREQAQAGLTTIQDQTNALAQQLATLQEQSDQRRAALRQAESDNQRLNEELARHKKQTELAEGHANDRQQAINELVVELGGLRDQLAVANQHSAELDRQLGDTQAAAQQHRQAFSILWSNQTMMLDHSAQQASAIREARQEAQAHAQQATLWQERSRAFEAQAKRIDNNLVDTAASEKALQKQVKSLTARIASAEKKLDQSNALLQARSGELAKTRQQLAAGSDQNNRLQSTLDEAQARIDMLTADMDRLRATATERKSLVDETRRELAALQDARKQTLGEREKLQQALEDAEQQLRSQAAELAAAQDRLSDKELALRELVEQQTGLNAQIDRSASARTQLLEQIREKDELIASMRNTVESAQRDKTDTEAALQQAVAGHEKQQALWAAELERSKSNNEQFATQLAEARLEQDKLKQQAVTRAAQIAELNGLLLGATDRSDALQAALDEEQRQRRSADDVALHQSIRNRDMAHMLAHLESLNSQQAAALTQATEDLDAVNRQLQQKAAELLASEDALVDLQTRQQKEAAQTQATLATMEQLADAKAHESTDRQTRLIELQHALDAQTQTNKTLTSRLQTLEDRIRLQDVELTTYRTVEKHLQATLAQVDDLQRAADERDSGNQALIDSIDQLQAADARRQEQVAAMAAENKRQAQALVLARSRITELEASKTQARQPVMLATADIADIDADDGQSAERDLAKLKSRTLPLTIAASATTSAMPRLTKTDAGTTAAPSLPLAGVEPAPSTGRPDTVDTKIDTIASLETLSTPATGQGQPPVSDIEPFVRSWAAAWSRQDVDAYLSHYSDEFRADSGISRTAWAAQRRVRVAKPKTVNVKVSSIEIGEPTGNRVRVTFKQAYRANHYQDRVTKTLELRFEGDNWKIMRESSK